MVKNSKGFTLVETIVSMAIIIIISFCLLPVLTKTKSKQIDTITLRGQYGCWYDKTTNSLKEWYFNERTPRTPEPREVTECKLILDTRPANFYILATGAGTSHPAQVKSVYTPALGNHLNIDIGRAGSTNTTTTVSTGASAEAIASGGDLNTEKNSNGTEAYSNGLIPENLKSCKLMKGDGECNADCEILQKTNYSTNNEYIVRVNNKVIMEGGVDKCLRFDEYGNPDSTVIDLKDLTYVGRSGSQSLDNVSQSAMDALSSANNYSYQCTADGVAYEFNFEYYDSTYAHSDNLLGYTQNNSNRDDTFSDITDKSKMSKIIDTISSRRQGRLTAILSELNAGAPNHDGAVLILW